MINKHKSNKIKENSNTVRHLNNGTDHRHSKSRCDQSSPARRTTIETSNCESTQTRITKATWLLCAPTSRWRDSPEYVGHSTTCWRARTSAKYTGQCCCSDTPNVYIVSKCQETMTAFLLTVCGRLMRSAHGIVGALGCG